MKQKLLFLALLAFAQPSFGQFGEYPPFTKWYQNPLGFQPLNLHTSAGIILPALAATACLLLTDKDTSIVNKFSWYDQFGVSWGYYGSQTTVYQNNVGLLFHARKWLALGGEFTTYHVSDAVNNTWGFGLRPFVRFYPIHREKFRLYFESGAGIIAFVEKFPQPSGFFGDYRTGTYLNGSPKYGIGAEFNLNPALSLQVGIQHVHISNGNTWGAENNPGHDSNGFSVGVMWRPGK